MALRTLTDDAEPTGRDGCVVVVIPLFNQHELFAQCLTSVLTHTPPDVAVLVADDASTDPASHDWVQRLSDDGHLKHEVLWSRAAVNEGFVGNCNRAFALTGRADVVLLNSDCVVAEGWLEGLIDAARGDGSIATSTALTNHGSIVSVPLRNLPLPALPQHTELPTAARAVRERSHRLRPRLPTAIGHCFLIRRHALDLVGGFDTAFAPGYGEEVDFSQRCLAAGLQHVLADEVLVLHHGGGSFERAGGVERTALQLEHEELIDARYPAYRAAVAEAMADRSHPLARALAVATDAILGPRVTVDVRCLGRLLTGTQVHALELVHALWRTRQVRLRLLLPDEVGAYAQPVLAAMDGVQLLRERDVNDDTPRDPIVHRPFQVSSLRDMSLLDRLGERLVVTHQDLIAYRSAHYFANAAAWERFRALTDETLALAAMTFFFTQHAADDALGEALVDASRVRVAHIGVDHQLRALHAAPARPAGLDAVGDRPFLVCVGTDFKHKNRLFALRTLEALRDEHGWDGSLVLCGPHVLHGGSAGPEAQWLSERPDVAAHVHDLVVVDEDAKQWLLEHAAAVVYPTTYEGFGLVPFEAAAAGVPCAFAPVSALSELLPAEAATLVPWDAAASAAAVRPLLDAGPAREAHVALLRQAAAGLTWDQTAPVILAGYRDALALPARDLRRVRDRLIRDAHYWYLRNGIGPTGMSLVAPPDPLLDEPVQRALAALARRPRTRGPLLATLNYLSRFGGGRAPAGAAPPSGLHDDAERITAAEDVLPEPQAPAAAPDRAR